MGLHSHLMDSATEEFLSGIFLFSHEAQLT